MIGSWVWKPGDRHARPTSCIRTPSRAVIGPFGGRTWRPLEDGRLVERSNLRGRGRLLPMRGDEGGSFLTVILAPVLPDGDEGSLFSGVPLEAPSCELIDMREGEEFAGAGGGAKVGQFFGLGSRVVCDEDNGAAAGATAVDMAKKDRT